MYNFLFTVKFGFNTIKARGLTTSIAIDVSQVVLKKTHPAFEISNVSINSESLVSTDGRNRDVSTIEITITRKNS